MVNLITSIREVSGFSIRKTLSWAVERGMSPEFVFDCMSEEHKVYLNNALLIDDYWIEIDLWVAFVVRVSEYFQCSVLKLGCMVNYTPMYDNIQIGLLRTLPISFLSKILTKHIVLTVNKNLLVQVLLFDKINRKIVLEYKPMNAALHRKEVCEYSMGITIAMLHWKGYCESSRLRHPLTLSRYGE